MDGSLEEPYLLAVPKDHRFARRQSVKLADLDGEPFIVRTRCDFCQDVTNVLVAPGIKMRVVYQTDQDDRALALVAAGIGLSLVPAHFEVSAVKQVPVLDLGTSRAIGSSGRASASMPTSRNSSNSPVAIAGRNSRGRY
jgi:DNA-binding transcriptional LysR family regulator